MTEIIKTDICIIGGGSGGLSLAAGAVQMGARVVLVEGHKMGGDCLNYGCVPSKSLLAAAHHAQSVPSGFGITAPPRLVDFAGVMDHVAAIIADIAPHDSVERFRGLGVKVIEAKGQFLDSRTLHVKQGGETGDTHIRAKRFVIATGSVPLIPPIAGLADVPYLTNETIFSLRTAPSHLLIIGAGPIGVEMAQAFVRLGCKVSVCAADDLLAREDRDLSATLATYLRDEGVALHLNQQVQQVAQINNEIEIKTTDTTLRGSHIMIAAGRQPNIEDLALDMAGIETSGRTPYIKTDARLRTSNKRVFAIGDVAGAAQFTHAANYHAGIVLRNILFRLSAKVNHKVMPRVTYTSPEFAHVGLTQIQAEEQGLFAQALTRDFTDNDRAKAERDTKGTIKLILGKRSRILGVSILGRGAGDLLAVWTLALSQNLSLSAMAGVIAPYPTRGEANKHIAGAYYTPRLFSPRTRGIVRFLLSFMR